MFAFVIRNFAIISGVILCSLMSDVVHAQNHDNSAAPPAQTEKKSAQALAVGSPMHDFGLRRLDPASGKLKVITWLSDFVGGKQTKPTKKLLLLNFYATWCKPCIAEMPTLQKIWQTYESQGLQILSLNFRNEEEDLQDAIKKTIDLINTNKLTYPILFDRYTNRNQLIYMGSQAVLPCNILINSDGIIVARFQGARASTLEELEQAIKKELQGSATQAVPEK